ncbi:MAG: sulfatase [Verrucomicrobiota bacterium]
MSKTKPVPLCLFHGLVLSLLICSGSVSGGTSAEPTQKMPNIVMMMVDDLGLYELNCYGYKDVDTPHSNRLAAEGMRFTNAYAGAPVCSPSRAAVISGQAPARLHLTNHISTQHFEPENPYLLNAPQVMALPSEVITYAEMLRDAGYACGFFGKWHLSLQDPMGQGKVVDEDTLPDNQGFENNIGGNGNGGPAGGWFSPYANAYLENGPEGEYLPDRLAREAVAFIEANKDQPFMVTMWNYTVHSPIETTQELTEKYKARKQAGADISNPVYAGMIEAADSVLGSILEKLDELGLAENTLVLLTSDNGGFNYFIPNDQPRLRKTKSWLYEGGLRVPLIVRWPEKIPAGTVNDTRVTHVDFFPTFMEAAGISIPEEIPLDGYSIMPVLTESGDLERETLYFHYPNYAWHAENRLGGAIIEGDYKLLNWYDDDSVELYNIVDDFSETNDVSRDNPELSDHLKKNLQQWLKDVEANMPVRNPDYVASTEDPPVKG